MTITRILALLSVMALLASLPIAALAQGGDAPPIPPFQVVGNATIDGEPAMDGTMVIAMIDGEKAGKAPSWTASSASTSWANRAP